ncbi:hypothetical protein [Dyadobacter sp. 32]|uniref:hypothetical protein n=1 Tax=Dyadobacter sp. 32 TaxID=538966 RepID=UPI0011EBD134
MTELPDDELDKLFRKSSEELDPYFDPNDWNDLKSRLDAEEGVRPAGWLRRWWPLGMLLLFLSGGVVSYYLLEKNNAKSPVTAVTVNDGKIASKPGVLPEIKVAESMKSSGSTEPEKANKTISVKTLSDNKTLTKSKSEKILPPSRSKAGGVFLEPNRSNGKVGEGAISSDRKKYVFESAKRNTTAIVQSANQKKATDENVLSPDENDHLHKQTMDSVASISSERSVFSSTEMLFPNSPKNIAWPLPEVVPASPIEEPVQTEKPSWPSPRFAVRAGYSPDLTTVGLKNLSKPGASVSLLAEYGVTKRLFFQTGVIWSNKIYRAEAADYTVPRKPQHYYGPDPVGVNGTCKVFEVPLNLQYAFFQGSYSRVFAGVGSSSYHMNSEVYRYQFENENDPKIGNWRGWHGSTGWYWFSNINASAGYERRISKTLSILAEPYVRIPVKKVGYGKVNLFTAGMWLSIRYAPFSR